METRQHYLTKKPESGWYGRSKLKTFTILEHGESFIARELCLKTGISYPSLGRSLSRWTGFKYIEREPIPYGGKYTYRLADQGRRWLALAREYLPNAEKFANELREWQASMSQGEIDAFLRLPHTFFVPLFDERIRENRSSK